MAKQTGLGDNFYIAGYNLSGDVSALGRIGGGPAAMDVTSIDKSAHERIGGLRDGSMEFTSWFNDATGQEHDALKGLPTTDVQAMYFRGTTLGNPAAACVGKQVNYDWSRSNDGTLELSVQVVSNAYGIEWGRSLTAGVKTDTTATNGTGIDTTASASFGWQAYLQVFSFTGTSCTVTLQDSADNATFAGFTGSAFTAATGRTFERIAGTNTSTVRRYVRAVTSGTFSSCSFAVVFIKNEIAGQVF